MAPSQAIRPQASDVRKHITLQLFTQPHFEHLASGADRNGIDKHHIVRNLPLGDLAVHVGQDILAGRALALLELDDQQPWPPTLPATVKDAGILDSRESRQKLLEQMTRFPPSRLAIACDPRRSPDRGSLGLIGELARSASETRVWLMQAPPGQALDADRLSDWHTALDQLGLPYAASAPLNWLENGHD